MDNGGGEENEESAIIYEKEWVWGQGQISDIVLAYLSV